MEHVSLCLFTKQKHIQFLLWKCFEIVYCNFFGNNQLLSIRVVTQGVSICLQLH